MNAEVAERLARIAYEHPEWGHKQPWDKNPWARKAWTACMTDVLKAMRDIDSGGPQILAAGRQTLYGCSEDPDIDDARRCFHAMIDAMLGNTGPPPAEPQGN